MKIVAALSAFALSAACQAQLIDFEPDQFGLLPDGSVAADDMQITNQFAGAFGVSFGQDKNFDGFIDGGSFAVLEQAGTDGNDGYLNDTSGLHDDPRIGFENRLGDWHLRTTGLGGGPADMVLMIEYASGVIAASGDIVDIDGNSILGTEQYRVTAFDAGRSVLGTIDSPIGTTIDDALNPYQAAPWRWAFDENDIGAGNEIAAIRIEFIGSKTFLIGLAFDNFNVSSAEIPAPASLGAVLLGLAGLGRRRR